MSLQYPMIPLRPPTLLHPLLLDFVSYPFDEDTSGTVGFAGVKTDGSMLPQALFAAEDYTHRKDIHVVRLQTYTQYNNDVLICEHLRDQI
jgi:hypothetical protein